MHLSTRSVHIAGVTTAPNGAYLKQVARNLTDVSDGFLLNSRYIIMDRDTKYTDDFRGYLDREGVKPVRCPVRAPRAYVIHYHTERNHQVAGSRLLKPLATVNSINEPIQCRERLGGMLNFYYREAA